MEINWADLNYQDLLRYLLEKGVQRDDRTGTGTLSTFARQYTIDCGVSFPLLTTKKMAWKQVQTELKWFLKGDTNIKYLVDNNCHIWDGDAYKLYELTYNYELEDAPLSQKEFIEKIKSDEDFARVWGNLGPIYGKQWRSWKIFSRLPNNQYGYRGIDQIANVLDSIKNNPFSRRHLVSAWNVGEVEQMTLPPCHYSFQFYVRGEYLDLMWNQRSADLFLGVPFNIASYALLLYLIAFETGYKPGRVIGSFGDLHLYSNHIEQAKLQLERTPLSPPKLKVISSDILNGEFEVELTGYNSHASIKAPLSN